MADLGTDAWARMMKQPAEKTSFQAGRDNRGAFATGAGANARNIEAGGIYIENNTGPVLTRDNQRSVSLRSFVPEEHQEILIDDHRYQVRTVDAILIRERRHAEVQQEPNGAIKNREWLQLFFQSDDSRIIEGFWHDVSFPCPEGGWVTFLVVVRDGREQIASFYVHGGSASWFKWPHDGNGVGLPISARKKFLLFFFLLLASFVMILNLYFKYQSDLVFAAYLATVMLCFLILRREHGRLNQAINKAQQAIRFHQL